VEAEVIKVFSGYQESLLAKIQGCFRDHLRPHHQDLMNHQVMMMGREMVPETSGNY
jgi:hypothetical protein